MNNSIKAHQYAFQLELLLKKISLIAESQAFIRENPIGHINNALKHNNINIPSQEIERLQLMYESFGEKSIDQLIEEDFDFDELIDEIKNLINLYNTI